MNPTLPLCTGYGRSLRIISLLVGFGGLVATSSLPAAGQTQASPGAETALPTSGSTTHKLVLCTDGTINGWGDNTRGQLGSNPTYAPAPVTVAAGFPSSVVRVVSVSNASFALLTDGTLWAWGDNGYGQLGIGSGTASTATATQVPGISHVVDVVAGFSHTIALCADGTVWSWGNRADGALGTGLSGAAIEYFPQPIPSLNGIRAIASGEQFSLALDANGHVWSWGSGSNGELGTGEPANVTTIKAAPSQLLLDNVRQIAAANNRGAALCTDGTVWNWGYNNTSQLGLGAGHTSYVATPTQVSPIGDGVWLGMNAGATVVVRPGGETYVWGGNNVGDLGIPAPLTAPAPIAGPTFTPNTQVFGQDFLFTAIERTGTVKTWGWGPLGYPGAGQYGSSSVPTTPAGVCRAVPKADFPECGPLRAYYLRPTATYEAARHGYTVSPAEVGTFGQLTTIDAGQSPYNGTVVFDGVYHLRGDVRFINGSFETRQGTVFYINGNSGRPTDSQATSIDAQNGTITLVNTELRAQCDEAWQGLTLGDGAQLYTTGAGKFQRQHSLIRDARVGVYNYSGHYYLYTTDFINNGTGVADAPRTTVLAGEGAQSCRFITTPTAGGPMATSTYGYGVVFYDTPETNAFNYYGDFGNAIFQNNAFDNLRVGVYGTAGNATFQSNAFTNCWQAAAYSTGNPNSPEAVRANRPTLPMVFRNNSFALPSNLPANYLATFPSTPPGYTTNTMVYGTTYGVNGQAGYELRNNTFALAPASTGVAARPVGLVLVYQGTALDNTFSGLAVGVEARSGEWYRATSYDFERNTFTDNDEGVSFLPPTYYNGPPTMNITLRCNTFSSQANGATGVWVKANTLFPAVLGSATTPNGNRFDGIANDRKRFIYDAGQPAGGIAFTYYRYNSGQEEFAGTGDSFYSSSGSLIASSTAAAFRTSIAGTNACGSSTTPGVYARSIAKTPAAVPVDLLPSLSEGYPNPAIETAIFTYSLPASTDPVDLVLRDLLGREVARQSLTARAGEIRLSVRHLPTGFYTSALETSGSRLFGQKLVVTH